MIRWIWSRMMKWGWDFSHSLNSIERNSIGIDAFSDSIDLDDPIRFKVQAVSGGTLVETSWYDSKKDNNVRHLHIITADQDLTESIGKIVSMELLRK